MADDDEWFVEQTPGRYPIVRWRGLVSAVALIIVAITGMGGQSALRRDHPIWHVALVIPLGLLFLGIAWMMSAHTKRR